MKARGLGDLGTGMTLTASDTINDTLPARELHFEVMSVGEGTGRVTFRIADGLVSVKLGQWMYGNLPADDFLSWIRADEEGGARRSVCGHVEIERLMGSLTLSLRSREGRFIGSWTVPQWVDLALREERAAYPAAR